MKAVLFAIALSFFPSFASASSPEDVCRDALLRYTPVPAQMLAMCNEANVYSAIAIDFASRTYTQIMSQPFFQTLLLIKSHAQKECAIDVMAHFSGRMNAALLALACEL